ncbi:arabinan endo-1,5-alpha-L-arabinosidase [Haloferula luteola]|uniref:Arabinan endo-1,5-alpha-L-arabinosidase n=1 Tax=Haloferula luteola TaxID=595692 RepID=A0A840V1N2_9BACT|nr:family 43 glycosylhydrolase [Haloferula luteola]MBB5350966.1 arabinan endo-1,5-alpha-L-arabinosidase [Haloferula luteola]
MKRFIHPLFIALTAPLLALATPAHGQDRTVEAHDPVLGKDGDTYYLFSTGKGIRVQSSKDLQTWHSEPPVFSATPAWVAQTVPAFGGDIWAPDIAKHNGTFYLYYSVSAFGRNTSAIGVATNTTLDPTSPNFAWKDHGIVLRSVPGRDLCNAIDPNLAHDADGNPWLTFGSFWNGIKLVKMQPDLLQPVTGPGEAWYTLASRPRDFAVDDRDAGDSANPELDYATLYSPDQLARNRSMKNGAIEAPFLFQKNGHYYLFLSWDRCCQGVSSTYKILVGRADNIRGPYLDRDGQRLVRGGGTLLLAGDGQDWAAAGHCAAYSFDDRDLLVFHAYDLKDQGKAKLRIREIAWDDQDWPVLVPED